MEESERTYRPLWQDKPARSDKEVLKEAVRCIPCQKIKVITEVLENTPSTRVRRIICESSGTINFTYRHIRKLKNFIRLKYEYDMIMKPVDAHHFEISWFEYSEDFDTSLSNL